MEEPAQSRSGPVGVPTPPRIRRSRALATVLVIVATFALLIVSVVLMNDRTNESNAVQDIDHIRRAAISQWWNEAYPDVTALQAVLDEAQRALRRREPVALASACQVMHDVAAVQVPAHLPAPDGDLGAELGAAAEDAHSAAHMCLSVIDQTPNNYDAEFVSNLEQASRQVKSAISSANEYLAGSPSDPAGP